MIEDKKIIQKLLIVLPFRFNYVVVAIEASKDSLKLTLMELMENLVTCEERMKKR